jgi:hypothetical protein
MAVRLYPTGAEGIAEGTIDWLNDDIKVAAVSSSYTFSAAHNFHDDLTGVIVTSGNLASKTSVVSSDDVILDAADTVVTNSASGTVEALVLYKDTGVSATSPLIAHIDNMSTAVNGVNFTIAWNASGIMQLQT